MIGFEIAKWCKWNECSRFQRQQMTVDNAEIGGGLVGHVHLNQAMLKESRISMEEILSKCEDTLNVYRKKKKCRYLFKKMALSLCFL
ncbi:hypothetical protein L2E82_36205 [Cichorium intybus]|uniref:Uncharacterized protein n=1 Tax=Cichorium intybus TaxID=13427 RepID=A0ACB9BQZ7_CICIN|nr:hypothetical protein L2E82_36205 [Cichorium intybus]